MEFPFLGGTGGGVTLPGEMGGSHLHLPKGEGWGHLTQGEGWSHLLWVEGWTLTFLRERGGVGVISTSFLCFFEIIEALELSLSALGR